MKFTLLKAVRQYAEGNIAKHRANVQAYLDHSVAIAEHTDIIDSIEIELKKMAEYEDMLDVLDKYFS
tara:strand:+ start:14319 stop:14519 length:201 start_codon:yes stop_codon:yes gene_type:complete